MSDHPRISRHLAKDLLRFVVAGSVDDGKSSLLGRLLLDAGGLFDDQLREAEVTRADGSRGLDLSRITDGLLAEREQQITMDVAYRYFTTDRRKFIVADTPGHLQYTRNMVTGASTADAALLLVDASRGPTLQTRRHAFVAARLGLRELVVCINKMDLVDWRRARFDALATQLRPMLADAGFAAPRIIPVSATLGDNVVHASSHLPWAEATLLDLLHALPPSLTDEVGDARFWVQSVLRAEEGQRFLAGRLRGGRLQVGDPVSVAPSGTPAVVAAILVAGTPRLEARSGESIAVALDRDVDCGRGDLLVPAGHAPAAGCELEADLVWFGETPLRSGHRLRLKMGTRESLATVTAVRSRVDLDALTSLPARHLAENDLGVVTLTTSVPFPAEPYAAQTATGSFILLDAASFATVGAGMVRSAACNPAPAAGSLPDARRARLGHGPLLVLLPATATAEDAAGLERRLFDTGLFTALAVAEPEARTLLQAGLVVVSRAATQGDWPVADLRETAADGWMAALLEPIRAVRDD